MTSFTQQTLALLLVVAVVFALWYMRYNQILNRVEQDVPHARYAPLPSGWDAVAHRAHSTAMVQITDAILRNPSAVAFVPGARAGLKYFDKSNNNCSNAVVRMWDNPFIGVDIANRILSSSTHYIGFGTDTGAALLSAARRVEFALGIEADPITFAHLSHNLFLNRDWDWSGHTYLQQGAIIPGIDNNIDRPQTLGGRLPRGSQCAPPEEYLKGQVGGSDSEAWEVYGYTLPTVLRHYGVPETKHVFIDVDVPIHNLCKLLSGWVEWIRVMRPTLHLTLNQDRSKQCSPDEYAVLVELSLLYSYRKCGAERSCDLAIQEGIWAATTEPIVVLYTNLLRN